MHHRGGNTIEYYDTSYHTIVTNPTFPAKVIIKLKNNLSVDYIIYNQGEVLNANYRGSPSRIDTMWCGDTTCWDWGVKAYYIFIRKYANNEPTVTPVESGTDWAVVRITNPNSYNLTGFQVMIPNSYLNSLITQKNEPLTITIIDYAGKTTVKSPIPLPAIVIALLSMPIIALRKINS